MSHLYIKDLHVNMGKETLSIPSLKLYKGEFFGILGHSGAGKSTLLKAIAGLIEVQSGSIDLARKTINTLAPHKRDIAMVFQEALLFEHCKVEEHLKTLLHIKKTPRKLWSTKIDEVLQATHATHLKYSANDTLSGGEKQRISIASALLFEPSLLLMDEPFSALDPSSRKQMRSMIKSLAKEKNITVIFVTHDQEEAFEIFDSMALVEHGKILQKGSTQELYENPKSLQVASYFNLNGIFEGFIKDGKFTCDLFTCMTQKSFQDGKYSVLIPPSAIKAKQNGSLCLPCIEQYYIKGVWQLTLEHGLTTTSPFEVDKNFCFEIDENHLHFFPKE